MKTQLTVLILALTLTGCETIQSIDRLVRPPKFDNAEYGSLVVVRQLAENDSQCDTTDAQKTLAHSLQQNIDWAKKYSEFLPRNPESFTMLTALKEESDRFVTLAEKGASPAYCKAKLASINKNATTIQQALGKK